MRLIYNWALLVQQEVTKEIKDLEREIKQIHEEREQFKKDRDGRLKSLEEGLTLLNTDEIHELLQSTRGWSHRFIKDQIENGGFHRHMIAKRSE